MHELPKKRSNFKNISEFFKETMSYGCCSHNGFQTQECEMGTDFDPQNTFLGFGQNLIYRMSDTSFTPPKLIP